MDVSKIVDYLLSHSDSDKIGLPAPPTFSGEVSERVRDVISAAEPLIGEAVNGDYYRCSRARFATLLSVSLAHLQPRSRVLDIGNAPGYLAIMLDQAGFAVEGINLSDHWNSTYPDSSYIARFKVRTSNIETAALPHADETFDAIVFTEVLEHIATRHPREILTEFRRVLKPGGKVIFSTPNVCNVSNVLSLLLGNNVFWGSDIFYGGTDRHNREFTPSEVRQLFIEGEFAITELFGMNDHANWRTGSSHFIYDYLANSGNVDHALMRNTVVGVFSR